jgi:hypothetical protein
MVRATAYFMTYRGHSIESPLWTLLRDGPSTLLNGRWPITLFVASTQSHPSRVEDAKQKLDTWMRRTWDHYRETCGAEPA